MKPTDACRWFVLLPGLLGWAAHAAVTWRVSVKTINDPANQRPAGITNPEIRAQIDFANANASVAGRGIVLELSEIVNVIPPAGASQDWFSVSLTDGDNKTTLEAEAMADPAYAWRTDKINIYVNEGTKGGAGSFPSSGNSIIVLGAAKIQGTPWTVLHEIGHFMSLYHTHQGQNCTDDEESKCSDCKDQVGGNDDRMADTLGDHRCFDQNKIAQAAFQKDYTALSTTEAGQVDNTFFNIMSYHDNRSIFTTQQLDAMCDTSNVDRDVVSHNNFVFVDALSAGKSATGLSQLVPVGGPFAQLKNGIDAASGGDVVLIRPGSYVEDREIRKAITLRAVRRDVMVPGNATIRAKNP